MKAAVLGERGVEIRDVAKPTPRPNEILVKVSAAALNRADVVIASGHAHGFAGGAGTILGGECAGEITAVGGDVANFKPGDRVAGSAPGSFSEYVAVDAGRAYKMPATGMAYETAACLPWALQTMHNAIVTAGRLKRGESVLIQGASSGVGLLGLQIAKLKGAAVVLGTSTNEGRRTRLKELGCDIVLDSRDAAWPEKAKAATDGKGVDLIVDQISAGVSSMNMQAAAVLARIVNVGRLGGMTGDFDFDLHALKRIDYIGVTFRTRSPDEFRAIVKAAYTDLWPAVEAGKLSLPIDRTFPLDEVTGALAHMQANAHFGKIVLVV
jgi:NADPH2:quinone reductase